MARTGTARLALGDFSDVVLIDGDAPGFAYLQVVPRRVQAWWSGAELATPTIMREGRWVD